MHFFIDHLLLTTQDTADQFGVDATDPENKFNVTSGFQLAAQAKAFACQDGLMVVQQSVDDDSLVNIILKPNKKLAIPFTSVNYYVYRGILKSSLINGANIVENNAVQNNELINRVYNTDHNTTSYLAGILGYDNNSLNEDKDILYIFNDTATPIQPINVVEGDWIADFGSDNKIGFEIILEAGNIDTSLAYFRESKGIIDLTGLSDSDVKAKQEQILNFIDPAAFFGLHYNDNVAVSTYDAGTKATVNKTGDDIYNLLLSFFATKNSVYLDLRSEYGYSYNYYDNYGDSNGNDIQIGNSLSTPAVQTYQTNGWPVVIVKDPMEITDDQNNIQFNLRIDDNLKPLLFFEDTNLLNNNSRIINETGLLNTTEPGLLSATDTGWTKPVTFYFPNTGDSASKDNVAYYIRPYYYRQDLNPDSSGAVLQKNLFFDNIFGPLEMRDLGNATSLFQNSRNEQPLFINGQHPPVTDPLYLSDIDDTIPIIDTFSHVGESGAYYDADSVVFYFSLKYSNEQSRQVYATQTSDDLNAGLNISGKYPARSFMANDINLTFLELQEEISDGSYQAVDVLDIYAYKGYPILKENLFFLGITQAELTSLNGITGFSPNHNRYVVFEELTPEAGGTDKNGFSYRKYKLKLQGLDSSNNQYIASPSTDINVYSTSGKCFTTMGFAAVQASAATSEYQLNYEEGFGVLHQDHFITGSPFQQQVDSFINTVGGISVSDLTYGDMVTLVTSSAAMLWITAVNALMAGFNAVPPTPDDRPLYWSRMKMLVALKQHEFFNKGRLTSNSRIELNALVQLFEKISRNYVGVDFSGAPTGVLKVLVTGFDPFQLRNNWKQSNPSGVCALYLHGQTLQGTLKNAYIQTMIMPVRYPDFDGSYNGTSGFGYGVVEKYIVPYIGTGANQADMIITISQALQGQYHIERFGTNKRGGFGDNLNFERPFSSDAIYLNYVEDNRRTWIETTLPVGTVYNSGTQLGADAYKHYIFYHQSFEEESVNPDDIAIPDSLYNMKWDSAILDNYVPINTNIFTTDKMPTNLINTIPESGGKKLKTTIINGSGGNYLSNEIFYRVALARERWIEKSGASYYPSGHFHVSLIQESETPKDFVNVDLTDNYEKSTTRKIYAELKTLLQTVKTQIISGIDSITNLFQNEEI